MSSILYCRPEIDDDFDAPHLSDLQSHSWWESVRSRLSLGGDIAELGCLEIGLPIAAICLIALGPLMMIELVIPGFALLTYQALTIVLNVAISDRHGSQRNVFKSLVWGALWATLLTAPIGAVILLVNTAAK